MPGGRVSKGDVLLRVDPRGYQAVVTQREAQVAQAELELQLEEGRRVVAEREWTMLGGDKADHSEDIALRRPQLVNATAQVEGARAALAAAKLDLERTALRAPFNGVVLSEGVDLGQVVSSASQAVTLVGTDRARVEVQLPVEQLSAVAIPKGADDSGSLATVTQVLGTGHSVVRSTRVHRLVGKLDPQTRTASLTLLVDDPQGGPGLPLMPGAYVNVDIEGTDVESAVPVPRSAIYEGGLVWLVGADDRLQRRAVEIGFRSADDIYVTSGLEDGERLVTSPLSMPIEGMKVRVAGAASAAASPAATSGDQADNTNAGAAGVEG